jgi:hypothetical protein
MSSQQFRVPVPTTPANRLLPLPVERRGGPRLLSTVEELIAAGQMPRVTDAAGRLGRILSYHPPTRQARVAWVDQENPGLGELVPVEHLRPW